MEEIKKLLEQNGIQYTYTERGKNKYIDIIAGKDGEVVTVRKGTYNVYTLLEKNEIGTGKAVFESSRKLEKIIETLMKRLKDGH